MLEIFRAMITRWQVTLIMVTVAVVLILSGAHMLEIGGDMEDDSVLFLECRHHSPDYHWEHSDLMGAAFEFLHIFIVMMTSLMAERTFYSIPHHMGWFVHPETVYFLKNNKEYVYI